MISSVAIIGIDHVSGHLSNADNMSPVADFYKKLGFHVLHEDEWRAGNLDKCSLTAGDNKVNIRPGPGVAPHIGWLWEGGIESLLTTLREAEIEVWKGPIPVTGGREGGLARAVAVCLLDPDGSPVVFISYDPDDIAKYPGQTPEEGFRIAAAQPDKRAAIAAYVKAR